MIDRAGLEMLRHANAERMRRALIDGSELVESLARPTDSLADRVVATIDVASWFMRQQRKLDRRGERAGVERDGEGPVSDPPDIHRRVLFLGAVPEFDRLISAARRDGSRVWMDATEPRELIVDGTHYIRVTSSGNELRGMTGPAVMVVTVLTHPDWRGRIGRHMDAMNASVAAPPILQLWEQTRAMLDRGSLPFGTPDPLGNVP